MKQRVLVVDDDHLIADSLKLIFALWGFNCRAAYSTDEALACAREFHPDLLLCDITMPERDGVELMQELSRTQPNCRMLVLTAHSNGLQRVLDEHEAWKRPIGLLTKPCAPDQLRHEAGAILAQA